MYLATPEPERNFEAIASSFHDSPSSIFRAANSFNNSTFIPQTSVNSSSTSPSIHLPSPEASSSKLQDSSFDLWPQTTNNHYPSSFSGEIPSFGNHGLQNSANMAYNDNSLSSFSSSSGGPSHRPGVRPREDMALLSRSTASIDIRPDVDLSGASSPSHLTENSGLRSSASEMAGGPGPSEHRQNDTQYLCQEPSLLIGNTLFSVANVIHPASTSFPFTSISSSSSSSLSSVWPEVVPSGISQPLSLPFAPSTYPQHISENHQALYSAAPLQPCSNVSSAPADRSNTSMPDILPLLSTSTYHSATSNVPSSNPPFPSSFPPGPSPSTTSSLQTPPLRDDVYFRGSSMAWSFSPHSQGSSLGSLGSQPIHFSQQQQQQQQLQLQQQPVHHTHDPNPSISSTSQHLVSRHTSISASSLSNMLPPLIATHPQPFHASQQSSLTSFNAFPQPPPPTVLQSPPITPAYTHLISDQGGLYPTLPTFLPANPYYQPKTDAGTDTFAAGTAEMMGSVAGKQVVPQPKIYDCEWEDCGKKCTRKQDLERHMVTHYKEKPHKCPDCDIRFSRKDAMRRHLKMERCKRKRLTSTSPSTSSRRGGSTTSPEMSEAMWKAGLR